MKRLLALKFSPKLDRPSPGFRGCHIGHSIPDLTVVIMQKTGIIMQAIYIIVLSLTYS